MNTTGLPSMSNPARGLPHPAGASQSVLRGFTLVEMIGVLVIIMILAMALVPSVLKELNTAALNKESQVLMQMGGALKAIAVNDHWIPGTNTVFTNIAAELGWQVSDVRTNGRGNARACMVDPGFRVGPGAGATPPYTQDHRGSTNPASARVLLLGSVGAPLPSIVFNPGSSSSNAFNLLWNSSDQTKPTGWTTSWGGDFGGIVIERINLDPLFVQLVLNKTPTNALPVYAVDGGTKIRITNSPTGAYFLLGTRLDLYDASTNLQTRQVLQDTVTITNRTPYFLPASFVYESGIWRGRLFMTSAAQRRTGTDLQAAYAIFMSTSANPNAKPTGSPVTQAQVTTDMFSFMSNYVYWCTNSFSSTKKTGATNALSAMISDSKNYVGR